MATQGYPRHIFNLTKCPEQKSCNLGNLLSHVIISAGIPQRNMNLYGVCCK